MKEDSLIVGFCLIQWIEQMNGTDDAANDSVSVFQSNIQFFLCRCIIQCSSNLGGL
jgi:hypothetical protein